MPGLTRSVITRFVWEGTHYDVFRDGGAPEGIRVDDHGVVYTFIDFLNETLEFERAELADEILYAYEDKLGVEDLAGFHPPVIMPRPVYLHTADYAGAAHANDKALAAAMIAGYEQRRSAQPAEAAAMAERHAA